MAIKFWHGRAIIMPPSLSNPYAYLTMLNEPADGDSAFSLINEERRQNAAQEAGNLLASSIGNPDRDIEAIDTAISFLQAAVLHERKNELAFIQSKINELATYDGPEIKEIKQLLSNIPYNNLNINQLILSINYVLNGVEETQARLKSLANSSKHNQMAYGQLNSVNTLIRQIRNEYTPTESESIAEIIRVLTFRAVNENLSRIIGLIGSSLQTLDVKDFASATILIQQLIYDYLFSHSEELDAVANQINGKNMNKAIENLWNSFTKSSTYKNISSSNNPYFDKNFQNAIKATQNFFHVDTDSVANHRQAGKKSLGNIEFNKIFQNAAFDSKKHSDKIRRAMRHITVKSNFQSTQRGNYMEIIRSLVNDAVISYNAGSYGTATDTFLVGQYNITVDVPDIESIQNINADALANILYNGLNTEEKKLDVNNLTQRLESLYKVLDKLGNSFFIHKSDKNYLSTILETKGKFKNFHGREINIMNYIGEIASLGVASGATIEWLNFAATNISSLTLGGPNVRATLESYFAIFAGILMFSDFQLVARAIINGTQTNDTSILHLYDLGGLYVPTSYFLQATLENVLNLKAGMESKDSFIAKIRPPRIRVNTHTKKWATAESWNRVKGRAQSGSVALTFAANFLKLVDRLLSFSSH